MQELTGRAFAQAQEADQGWVGPEHLLLALLTRPSVAAETLAELGVTHERLAGHLRDRLGDPDHPTLRYDPERPLALNPAAHALRGRGEGLAIARGHPSPGPEHWLLAMAYDDSIVGLLHVLGTSPRAVLDVLQTRGVEVPDVEPPTYRPWRGHRRVDVGQDDQRAVIDLLVARHPPGSAWRWGVNALPGAPPRLRVDAEEGVDLEGILAEARRAGGDPGSA